MMYNLKLTSNTTEQKDENEYYIHDRPAQFLSNINNINIIVGANNSRKSRFIRQVIQLEGPALIGAKIDLNIAHYIGVGIVDLVETVKRKGLKKSIIGVTYLNRIRPEIVILKSYFEKRKNRENGVINADDIIALVNEILDKLFKAPSVKYVDELTAAVDNLITICDFIHYLYNHCLDHGGIYVHSLSFPNSPFKESGPYIPDLSIQHHIPFLLEILEFINRATEWCHNLQGITMMQHFGKNIYIPALRTSRKLLGINKDVFEETIRHQHFREVSNESLEIHTGLKLYEKIMLARNGNKADRDAFSEFEKFIGVTFFKTDSIHIVPYKGRNEDEDGIKVTIPGQRSDVPVQDLGEGVQGIINLLFPVFTSDDQDWIFIDEPENHLHPGFQNIFVKAITENEYLKGKKLRFFVNTHSNHILSEAFLSSSNCSTFIFSRRNESSSNIKTFEQDHYNILDLLGVMNTSVFTTNCTVWVEGITDRFYLRAFLQAYLRTLDASDYHPNEGFDYSFIEYAGKNLLHYNFSVEEDENISAYFVNSKVFVLADSDFDLRKHRRYQKINRKNFHYVQTRVPEIENLLPGLVIRRFLLDHLRCDEPSLRNLPFGELNDKLGKAFRGITKNGKLVNFEASHGGTLNAYYKSMLSKYVFDKITEGEIDWQILSTSKNLNDIVKKLYRFIVVNNNRQ